MSRSKASAGAAQAASRPGWPARLLQDHSRALGASLKQMRRRPFGTLLTIFVIGLTLALPAGLHTLVRNLDLLGDRVDASLRVSLFLKDSVGEEQAQELTRSLRQRAGVADAQYLSRERALAEFKRRSGFAQALDALDDNPLPAVIVVTPDRHAPQAQAQALVQALSQLPEVAQTQFDQAWRARLYALLALLQRMVWLLAAALGLAALAVTANTLRLELESRHREIEVLKLIGASDGFIRRPFLYAGMGYGLAGALAAGLLVVVAGVLLVPPARELARLYDADFSLRGPAPEAVLGVLGAGLILGWLAAFWSVSRQLRRIEPA